MKEQPFDLNEFTRGKDSADEKPTATPAAVREIPEEAEESAPEELDVQKAVVEELAAEKAEMESDFGELKRRVQELEAQVQELAAEKQSLLAESSQLRGGIAERNRQLAEKDKALAELFAKSEDEPARNPNALALLDREVELPDRFPGESRDHVLEVIREARESAEKDGRLRRAQILESVLVANEPSGNLEKKREELRRLFAENMNVVNGTMIEKLKELGLAYRNGEEYLSAEEILRRAY